MFNHSPPKQHRFQFRPGRRLFVTMFAYLLSNIRGRTSAPPQTERIRTVGLALLPVSQSNQAKSLFLLQDAARFRAKNLAQCHLAEISDDIFAQRFGQSDGCK